MKFQISYPLDIIKFYQTFGQNAGMYADPKYGGIKGHNGIDLMATHGTPIYATHDGYANYEVDNGGGHGVVVTSDTQFDYKGQPAYFKTIYWHLVDSSLEPKFKSPIEGKFNVEVRNGELIGYADNTGASTGDHLHFGLKPMAKNPDGSFYNLEQTNGYLGAIDPVPYFDGSYPKGVHELEEKISLLKRLINLWKTYRNK
jgi:murein DD-endopeptidase MepM/ murein hydrolase activator NlpD